MTGGMLHLKKSDHGDINSCCVDRTIWKSWELQVLQPVDIQTKVSPRKLYSQALSHFYAVVARSSLDVSWQVRFLYMETSSSNLDPQLDTRSNSYLTDISRVLGGSPDPLTSLCIGNSVVRVVLLQSTGRRFDSYSMHQV